MRVYKLIIVTGVFAGLYFGVLAKPHSWTSRDGKTAVAEFHALEGDTLVLKKGSKTIRVPLDQFSDEDQAYAHKMVADARKREADEKAEQERLEKERVEKIQDLLGLRNNASIIERCWADWEDYYTRSVCGEKMMEFFMNERSIVDDSAKGLFVSVEESIRPPDYAPKMITYCPSDYDGKEKLGVYIHVSPGGRGISPKPGYPEIMDKYRLVYASPHGTSNKESDMRRCAITLDALAQLRKDYTLDENRIYVGGFSGGGAISTFIAFLYPEEFRAALNSARIFSLTADYCLPFAEQKDIRTVQKYKQPYAFISGPDDMNYKGMPGTEANFKEHRFVVRFFDIPGMKHQTAPSEAFDKVMQWVEEKNPRL